MRKYATARNLNTVKCRLPKCMFYAILIKISKAFFFIWCNEFTGNNSPGELNAPIESCHFGEEKNRVDLHPQTLTHMKAPGRKPRGMEGGQATQWKRRESPGKSPCIKGNQWYMMSMMLKSTGRKISYLVHEVGIIWARSRPHPIYQIKFKISISL